MSTSPQRASGATPRRILVAVAWPYANGLSHIGHLAGAYLPPDIFARYHRMAGNDVLMVSGTDAHGTPITVQAEQEGVAPAELWAYPLLVAVAGVPFAVAGGLL